MKENEELLKDITEQEDGKNAQTVIEEQTIKFLIFRVGAHLYALYADEVREIIGGNTVFYLPFAPAYIRGLINRHGEPHTVFDVHALLEQKQADADSFLVLKIDDDKIAFLISEILEIIKIPENEINTLTSRESEMRFFKGSISVKGDEVFILHVENLLRKLDEDLEKV
jgi:purine-binding chemotaxis protein CheW